MKNIFITPDRRAEWSNALKSGDPTAVTIRDLLESPPASPDEVGDPNKTEHARLLEAAFRKLCLAWLNSDTALAGDGHAELLALLEKKPASDLSKAANALSAVLAWDLCNGLWNESARKAFAERFATIARSFLEITQGNPHVVTNNWWMLTHGGCLLACIAVDGEEGTNGKIDLSDLKEWSLHRFKAFCQVFGNAGLYHEGSGYITYTLSMLMPALLAVERHLDPDILKEFPQFRSSLASMLVGTSPFAHSDNGAVNPTFGAALQWNDTGRSCLGPNPFLPAIWIAPEKQRGALRRWFDRTVGIKGRNEWDATYSGLPLAVALYPFSVTAESPDGVLPKQVIDQRQGLGMWRSEWNEGSEIVFGWYARSTHAGGHSQDDAASIRLMALGRTWICGGGQARSKAEWQSAFTHANMSDRPKPAPLAHVSSCSMADSGGVVSIDTRKSLGAYSERILSWRKDLEYPFVLAVMDLLDEHRDPPLDWQWNLSFPRELESRIHDDGAGFSLLDVERGCLTGRFLIDVPGEIEIAEMPPSTRTFSHGKKVDYPGDRFLHACFQRQKQSRILVALVVSAAERTNEPEITFRDNAIHLDGKPWRHPFSPAILKSVDLAQSPPNRMTRPAG